MRALKIAAAAQDMKFQGIQEGQMGGAGQDLGTQMHKNFSVRFLAEVLVEEGGDQW